MLSGITLFISLNDTVAFTFIPKLLIPLGILYCILGELGGELGGWCGIGGEGGVLGGGGGKGG